MSDVPHTADSPPPARAGRRRWFWVAFRWLRISCLLLILFAVVFGIYLNKVGLPEPVKQRVVAQLRDSGWEVEFSRLRLRWYRGLVMEHLHLRRTTGESAPQVFADYAECPLDRGQLLRRRFEPLGLRVQGGRLIWILTSTNAPELILAANELRGDLRRPARDTWELQSLHASIFGCHVELSGLITNASAIRDWKFPRPAEAGPVAPSVENWRQLRETFERIRFTEPPVVLVRVRGDARQWTNLQAWLQLRAGSVVSSPWLQVNHLAVLAERELPDSSDRIALRVQLSAASAAGEHFQATNVTLNGRLVVPIGDHASAWIDGRLRTAQLETPWLAADRTSIRLAVDPVNFTRLPSNATVRASLTQLRSTLGRSPQARASLEMRAAPTNPALVRTELKLNLAKLERDHFTASNTDLTLSALHARTNVFPAEVRLQARGTDLTASWGQVDQWAASVEASLPAARQLGLGATHPVWPDALSNVVFEASLLATNFRSPHVSLARVEVTNSWRGQRAHFATEATLRSGRVRLTGDADAATRRVRFEGDGSLDPHDLQLLFSRTARPWLAEFEWRPPPRLTFTGEVLLPAWTNRNPRWIEDALPTVSLAGAFDSKESAFQDVRIDGAHVEFTLTNLQWELPHVVVARPEGTLRGAVALDQLSQQFRLDFESRIDPQIFKPLVRAPKAKKVFELFAFTAPPALRVRAAGTLTNWWQTGLAASLALTNLTFRGERIEVCTADAVYTNGFVTVLRPLILRPGERAEAEALGIDVVEELLYLTNAHGVIDPHALTRAIGPKTYRTVAPYQFALPPTGHVWGVVDLDGKRHRDDVHFEIQGGPFQWQVFQLERLKGHVHWQGQFATLTNVQGKWRGGPIEGWLLVDDRPVGASDLSFNVTVQNVNLHDVMSDFGSPTNKMEGLVSGSLRITSARTTDWKSWNGYGEAQLRDGLLWAYPIFGAFSSVLNTFSPGWGSSRAKEGHAHFTITNSVIHSANLEIKTTTMRMQYDGQVDFDRRVTGRMEAEILREVPGVGLVLSRMFWPVTKLFVYRISGTLDEPKTEPIYILPKILLFPFHPVKTMKDIFSEEERPETRPPPK